MLFDDKSFLKLIVVSSLSEYGMLFNSSFLCLKFAIMFESSFALFSDFALFDKTDEEILLRDSFSDFLFLFLFLIFVFDIWLLCKLLFLLLFEIIFVGSFTLNLGLSLIFLVYFIIK